MTDEYDVVVIGGGSAGVAASVSAARRGAHTLLIERHGYLGGAGTISLVHTFCGLYLIADEPTLAHPGLPSELAHRLIESGVAQHPIKMGRVHVLPHHPLLLAAWYDDFCANTKGLDVRLHTEVVGAKYQDRLMTEVDCLCRGSKITVNARSFIDASGDAILAAATDQPWAMVASSELQRPAYIAGISGASPDLLTNDGVVRLAGEIALAVRAGNLSPECLGAHFRASQNEGEVFVTLDLPGGSVASPFDPLNAESLTGIEKTGRTLILSLLEKVPALAGCYVSAWPIRGGIRESRRWRGLHELSDQEILGGTTFEDGVALATWPLELREKATGPRFHFPTSTQPAEIPLRSLQAAALDNVFTAGRCISANHRAQASIRVMGTALATGQAAGIAAAEFSPFVPDDSLANAVRKALSEMSSDR